LSGQGKRRNASESKPKCAPDNSAARSTGERQRATEHGGKKRLTMCHAVGGGVRGIETATSAERAHRRIRGSGGGRSETASEKLDRLIKQASFSSKSGAHSGACRSDPFSLLFSNLCSLSSRSRALCSAIMRLSLLVLALLVAGAAADVYLHSPRGSNDRLDEAGRNRNNANRFARAAPFLPALPVLGVPSRMSCERGTFLSIFL
jgi:hypothetical protein